MKWRRIVALVLVALLLIAACVPALADATEADAQGSGGEAPTGQENAVEETSDPNTSASETEAPGASDPNASTDPTTGADPNAGTDPTAGADPNAGGDSAATPDATPDPNAPTPEPTQPLMQDETSAETSQRPKMFIVLYDCGHAMYGTSFEKSCVTRGGDPNGELLKAVEQILAATADGETTVGFFGYHSDLFPSKVAPISALDDDDSKVDGQIQRILNTDDKERKSSMLSNALGRLITAYDSKLDEFASDYDCTLIAISGGVENSASGTPSLTALKENATALRNKGIRLRFVCLDPSQWLKSDAKKDEVLITSELFNPGEYISVPIARENENTQPESSYDQARFEMLKRIAAVFTGSNGAYTEYEGTSTELHTKFAIYSNPDDPTIPRRAVILRLQNGNTEIHSMPDYLRSDHYITGASAGEVLSVSIWEEGQPTAEQGQPTAEQGQSPTEEGGAAQDITGAPTPTPAPTQNTEIETLKAALNDLRDNITETTGQSINVGDGNVEIPLPEGFDPGRAEITSSNPAVLDVSVESGKLVLKPVSYGSAEVVATSTTSAADGVKLQGNPIPIQVHDRRMEWSWSEESADYRLTSGGIVPLSDAAEEQPAAPVSLSVTIHEGTLCCQIDRLDANGQSVEMATGRSDGATGGSLTGLNWSLSAEGNNAQLLLQGTGIGSYNISCWSEIVVAGQGEDASSGTVNQSAHESRELHLHRPLDAAREVSLIAPYFRRQSGQLLALTSGGEAARLEDYDLSIDAQNVVAVYTTPDGGDLFIEPLRSGSATVTLQERGMGDPQTLVIPVRVSSLFSRPVLWISIVGIAICLIGLTSAIVIVIGKSKQKSAEGRD